jgi:hypothetical protein
MNAIQLQKPDGTPVDTWKCSQCGICMNDKGVTERCCICAECEQPLDRSKDYSSHHPSCWTKQARRNYVKQLANATPVLDHDGPVYSEDGSGGQDGYYESLEEFIEAQYDDPPEVMPRRVFCCTTKAFELDIDRALENECEEHHEDTLYMLDGIYELQDAVNKFNELNKNRQTWEVDYRRCVEIPDSEIERIKASQDALAIQRAEAEGMTTTNTKGQG